jgi:hypothetical protein
VCNVEDKKKKGAGPHPFSLEEKRGERIMFGLHLNTNYDTSNI